MEATSTNQIGIFGFIAPNTPPSLWRNGKDLMIRDADGGLSQNKGVDLQRQRLPGG